MSTSRRNSKAPRDTNKLTASRKVEAYIKQALYRGFLAPRERIIEGDIARQLGVSRGPVREALLRLETEGLIVINPRRGTFVRDFPINEIAVIFKMRSKLEALSVWYMRKRMTRRCRSSLTAILRRMKLAATKRDDNSFFYADMEFHRTIWKLSGEPRLYRTLSRIVNPFIFEIARTYSNRTPISQRYESHRGYCDMILRVPLGRVEREVERYFNKTFEETFQRPMWGLQTNGAGGALDGGTGSIVNQGISSPDGDLEGLLDDFETE